MNILSNLIQPMSTACASITFKKWCGTNNTCVTPKNGMSMKATWGQYRDSAGRVCGPLEFCNCGC